MGTRSELLLSRLMPADAFDLQIAQYSLASETWVAKTLAGQGNMVASIYDPRGIEEQLYNFGHKTGTIDCGEP